MIDERQTGRVSGPAFDEQVDRPDGRHLLAVLWRWKVLIAAGTIFFLAAAFALLRLTPINYQASKIVTVQQPALQAGGDQGRQDVAKITALLPTFARLATSDQVMSDVQNRLATPASVSTLRARLTVAAIPSELSIRIDAHDRRPSVANRLTEETAAAFIAYYTNFQTVNGVAPDLHYVFTSVTAARAERPSRNALRTLVLTALLGFAVMSGVAYLLEYAERP